MASGSPSEGSICIADLEGITAPPSLARLTTAGGAPPVPADPGLDPGLFSLPPACMLAHLLAYSPRSCNASEIAQPFRRAALVFCLDTLMSVVPPEQRSR